MAHPAPRVASPVKAFAAGGAGAVPPLGNPAGSGRGADAQSRWRAEGLEFALDTDATAEQLATLEKLTERYCVVLQTLRTPPALSVRTTT